MIVNQAQQIVAYFDFDGTISDRDTFIPFLIYTVGQWKFVSLLPRLIPVYCKYSLGLISNELAKELTLGIVLRNYKHTLIEQKARDFALTRLNKYIKPQVYARLEWHREHQHTLVLVSANLGIYLRYWAKLHRIPYVIATEIEVNPMRRLTGKLYTRNCYGPEKVMRINQFLQSKLLNFCYSYAYGNSNGDKEMLAYADEAYYVSGDRIEHHEP